MFTREGVRQGRSTSSLQDERRLVFPAQALEQARRQSPKAQWTIGGSAARRPSNGDGTAAAGSGSQRSSFIANIDATLDDMQRKVDSLREDVGALKFPVQVKSGPEDLTPDRPAA